MFLEKSLKDRRKICREKINLGYKGEKLDPIDCDR
jgi:hypothetical protein